MLLALFIALQAVAARPAHSPAGLSVCELLAKNPTSYNGKEISVRGFLSSTDEGVWLAGDCKAHLVTKHYAWDNIISIYVDVSDESIARSWQHMSDRLTRLHVDPQKDRVRVTIVGRLDTRKTMDEAVGPGPDGPRPRGFGHQGAAPAEINVISVRDLKVEHRPHGDK